MGKGDLAALLVAATGALLCVAAVSKARAQRSVEVFLGELGLGEPASRLVARSAVCLELGVGVVMLAGLLPLGIAIAATAFGVIFVAVQHRAVRLEVDASCGCFGSLSGSRRTGWDTARAWLFFGLAGSAALSCWLANATVSIAQGYVTSRMLGIAIGCGCVVTLAIAEQSSLLILGERTTTGAEA
jgi:hypothetical protein